MNSKSWVISLYGANLLDAKRKAEAKERLAGWKSACAYGCAEDLQEMGWPTETGTVLSITDFLNNLEEGAEGVIFPFGWRLPEVVPVPSVVLLWVPRGPKYWALPDLNQAGVDRESARAALQRSQLIVTNSSEVTELIQANCGDASRPVWTLDRLDMSFDQFVTQVRKKLIPPSQGAVAKNQIRFSIVTPSFNQASFIERTLQSVLRQDYGNFEYIVIDGASKDGTVDILRRYEDRLSWISEPDRGYAEAVNKGVARAKGDYVMWVPSDDLLNDPQVLSRLAATIQQTGADVVYGDAFYIDSEDRILSSYRVRDYGPEALVDWCLICQPSTVFRRSLYNQVGGLNPKLRSVADYELWMRFSEAGAQFARTGHIVSRYRLHPQSITTRQRFLTFLEIFECQWRYHGRVGTSWVRAALAEVRVTVFGLFLRHETYDHVSYQSHYGWGRRFKDRLRAFLMWEKLLKFPLFQSFVFRATQLSYRLGRYRFRWVSPPKPTTDVGAK